MLSEGIDQNGHKWKRKELHHNSKDYTNQKFTYLTPLFPIYRYPIDNHSYWLCKCDCGKIISTRTEHLVNGKTKSCGCYSKQMAASHFQNDLTGKRFGKLTVQYRTNNKKGRIYYHCKCDCGKEIDVIYSSLVSGNTKSCGCLKSWKEEEIEKILIKNNIKFNREYRFKNCKDKNPLPFDFAIFKKDQLIGLIEYQGVQHFTDNNNWGEHKLNLIQKHDNIKEDFCRNNNLPLLILDKNSNLEKEIIAFINQRLG